MWYFTWILGLGVVLAGIRYAFGALDEATTHERFGSPSGVPAAPVAN